MSDPRIPVIACREAPATPPPETALLSIAAPTGHRPACPCCRPRSAAADALGRLFLARARDEIAFFRRVLAVAPDAAAEAALAAALAEDPLVRARFRAAPTA